MQSTKETVEILNDLIQINNDRITGYENAIGELTSADSDLKTLFESMIDQSRQFRLNLGTEVQALGADMDMSTTTSGKIYRGWMDLKAIFTGHDRHTVLSNCEFGEDAAQKAYKAALESDDLPAYLHAIIQKQKTMLLSAHDEIKALRDQTVDS